MYVQNSSCLDEIQTFDLNMQKKKAIYLANQNCVTWRVSPFHANTAAESLAMAAAAWSWVEKILQEHQRTSAPSAVRVSIRTAVWIVMWSEPEMQAPAKGFDGPNSVRHETRPGISTSASSISSRPKSAWAISLTLNSRPELVFSTNKAMVNEPEFFLELIVCRWGWEYERKERGSGLIYKLVT